MRLHHFTEHSDPNGLSQILHRLGDPMLHIGFELTRHQVRALEQVGPMRCEIVEDVFSLHWPRLEVEIKQDDGHIRLGFQLIDRFFCALLPDQPRAAQYTGYRAPHTRVVFYQ